MDKSIELIPGFKFHEDLVLSRMSAADQNEAIALLANLLYQAGNVDAGFLEALLKREVEYPTGLPTVPFGTAIPHASPEHVKKTAVAVGVLEKPVQFQMMGAPEIPVQVKAVFVLGIKEAHAQVKTIQFIVEVLQQPNILESIVNASDPKNLVEILNQHLSTYNLLYTAPIQKE